MEKYIIALFHVSQKGANKKPSLYVGYDGTKSFSPFGASLFDWSEKLPIFQLCGEHHVNVLIPATEDALEPILGADHDVTELLKHLYTKQNIPLPSHV